MACQQAASAPRLSYPDTRRDAVVDDYYGTKVPDPYRWMEDLDAKEVADWIRAQNDLTFGYLEQAPHARALPAAHHRALELSESHHSGQGRRPLLLSEEQRTAAPVSAVGQEHARRGAQARPRPQHALAGRIDLPCGVAAFAGRASPRLWAVAGRCGLGNAARSGRGRRPRFARRGRMDALLGPLLDEGRRRASSTRATRSRPKARSSRPRSPTRPSTITAWARRSRRIDSIFERKDLPTWFVGGSVTEDGRYLVVIARQRL